MPGPSQDRVTGVQKQRPACEQFVMMKPHFTEGWSSDFSRQRKVVDLPARVIRAVRPTSWSSHCMLGKMRVSNLSHSWVGMGAVERAAL
jgi:hypothetical protein